MLRKEEKLEIVKDNQLGPTDTGSPEVQIALLTDSIQNISEHIKQSQKDFHCRKGLLKQVSLRRSLLDYLKRTNLDGYKEILKRLKLRR